MNPTTTAGSLSAPSLKPTVNITQIDNGYFVTWYDNKNYQNHQVYAADLSAVETKLAEIFA
jgi:hypothetical protein